MGWTSFNYTKSSHLKFNASSAYDFCYSEYNKNEYEIKRFYFQKARNRHDKHVCYLVINHPNNYNFILVVNIIISDGEICFIEFPASFGPVEDKCPCEFLSLIKIPKAESHEYRWFLRVLKNKVKFKKQLSIKN